MTFPEDQRHALETCLRQDGKIHGVLLVRRLTSCGLKEAADFVHAFGRELEPPLWGDPRTSVDLGTLAVVSRETRTMLAVIELPIPYTTARHGMPRPPDFERPHLASWGNVTQDDVELLIAEEPDDDLRDEALEDVRELGRLSGSGSKFWSLFYRRNGDEQ